ncbi:MAG: hypothetical protein DWQ37_05305 [Planctomycetota bacterium]|nr:MAG: hypothetical protein DWQ37_05305 [Planctomycetota bacterium]
MIGCVALLVTALVGCQNWKDWNWRGKGYDDDVNSLTKGYRPAGDERSFSGLDARARDIESNLGVR